jgi:hypothetical protein
MTKPYIDIVFDGPPSHESGRFVEVEDAEGKSISVGEWIDRGNGLWALRLPFDNSRQPAAQPGDVFAFEYPNTPELNRTLTVVRTTGNDPEDMVFFTDRSYATQKGLKEVRRVTP